MTWALWRGFHFVGWQILGVLGRLSSLASASRRLQISVAEFICTPMESRFLRYQRFLKAHPYGRVLLTDVRDVLFQSDPFLQLPTTGLAASVEVRRYTIATEPLNQSWMRQCYGTETVAEIGGNAVSCVGVTYGDGEAIKAYLDLMVNEILGLSTAAARRGGADTAVHNYLLWTRQLEPVQLLETLASPVATLNGIPESEITLRSDKRLLNRDGSEPSVLHQYDRFPGLASSLLRSLASTKASLPANGSHV